MEPATTDLPNPVGNFQAILDVASDSLERLDETVPSPQPLRRDRASFLRLTPRVSAYMKGRGVPMLRLVVYVHHSDPSVKLEWINHDYSSELDVGDLPQDLNTLQEATIPVDYIVHIRSLCEKTGSLLPRDRVRLHDLRMIRRLKNFTTLAISPMVELRSFSGVPSCITRLLMTHQTRVRSYRFLAEMPRMQHIKIDHCSFPARTIVMERMTGLQGLSLEGVVTFSSLSNVPTDNLDYLNIRGTSIASLRTKHFPRLKKLVLGADQTDLIGKDVKLPSIICIDVFGSVDQMTERRLAVVYGSVVCYKPQ